MEEENKEEEGEEGAPVDAPDAPQHEGRGEDDADIDPEEASIPKGNE